MATVGEMTSEAFVADASGETWTRVASYVGVDDDGNPVAVTWSPTFQDNGDGTYTYTYTPDQVGSYSWIGTGTVSGTLVINFDVDGDSPASTVILTAIPIVGSITGSRVGLNNLTIPQGVDHTIKLFWYAGDDLIDSTNYSAQLTARSAYGVSPSLLFLSTSTSKLATGFDPPKWTASTVYGVGQHVVPKSGLNGLIFEVIVAGTSGSSEPTWPTTIGPTVSSGSVTFQGVSSDAGMVSNLRIQLTPDDTIDLTPFAEAEYDLIWKEHTSGKWIRLMQGYLTLSPNMSVPPS